MKSHAILVVSILLASCRSPAGARETYPVHDVGDAEIAVDGKLDEIVWDGAALETSFAFPWQAREAPATEFRALTDETYLYFAFVAQDADIVIDDGSDEEAVARGDRVELFFTPDSSLDDYICLEIDPSGRVLDYRASYYREFDFEWDLPAVVVATALTGTGYIVEGRIPRAGLPAPAGGGRFLTGVFRAEYSHREGGEPLAEWISWVLPDSEEPDFHIPSAFGWFEPH